MKVRIGRNLAGLLTLPFSFYWADGVPSKATLPTASSSSFKPKANRTTKDERSASESAREVLLILACKSLRLHQSSTILCYWIQSTLTTTKKYWTSRISPPTLSHLPHISSTSPSHLLYISSASPLSDDSFIYFLFRKYYSYTFYAPSWFLKFQPHFYPSQHPSVLPSTISCSIKICIAVFPLTPVLEWLARIFSLLFFLILYGHHFPPILCFMPNPTLRLLPSIPIVQKRNGRRRRS